MEEFRGALLACADTFEAELSADDLRRLGDYYQLVMAWNARLHLVAPCGAREFATRHVLESLVALRFLLPAARIVDVGSGAGLPVIPCLAVRSDLQATLVEASAKKAVFLREALRVIGASERARVIAKRFEETPTPEADFVTCRALERFTEMFEKLVAWSPTASTLLFFGGPTLQEKIEQRGLDYKPVAMPESARRFLFVINGRTPDDV